MWAIIVLVATLWVQNAYAAPTYVCNLVCQRSRQVIVDGVLSTEVDRCRCAGDSPTPTATPAPTPLPDLCLNPVPKLPGEENGWGWDQGRPIVSGATQNHCLVVDKPITAIDWNIYGGGATTCFWATSATLTPPKGSALPTQDSFGTNIHLGYFQSGQILPRGAYRVSVTASNDAGCGQQAYKLAVRVR